ncbi:MAG: hypothetical protein ACKPE6_14480, partial [Gammaproteobacteria bacterium]
MFSQELRFASTAESRWRWTVGGNYFWESAKQEGGVFVGPQTADQLIWDLQIAPLIGLTYDENVLGGTVIPQFLADIGGLDSTTLYPGAGLDFFMNSVLSPFAGLSQPLTGRQLIAQVPYWLDSFKIDGEYESWAAFGETAFDISDTFTLTGGLRYTRDSKDFGRYIAFNPYGVPLAFQEETRVDANGRYDPAG